MSEGGKLSRRSLVAAAAATGMASQSSEASEPAASPDISLALQRLIDINAITVLKAQYARFVDTRQWQALNELFAPDCDIFWEDELPDQNEGDIHIDPAQFIEMMQRLLPTGSRTVHHIYAPDITVHDGSSASGIWAMDDYVDAPGPGGKFRGYGHYFEDYRKIDGAWKIATWRLTRIRVDPFD